MNLGLYKKEQITAQGELGGLLVDELQRTQGALTTWGEAEHDEDGKHTDITADSLTLDDAPAGNIGGHLVPQDEDLDLGRQANGIIRAWRTLWINTSIALGSVLSVANTYVAAWIDSVSGTDRETDNSVTGSTWTIRDAVGTVIAILGGNTAIGNSSFSVGAQIPTLAVETLGADVLHSDNGLQVINSVTLANNGTYDFPGAAALGMLFITSREDTAPAIFMLRGATNVSFEVSDAVGVFTQTLGTAGMTNIGWTGTAYRIQNLSGGSRTYDVVFIAGTGIL